MRLFGLGVATMLAISCVSWPALARPLRPKHRVHVLAAATPSEDAVELGYLAPPTRLTTLTQDYGDAAYARAHVNQRYRTELGANGQQRAGGGTYLCDPREAAAIGFVCRGDQKTYGYGQFYAFTPAYVSSPQVVGAPANLQDEVLPPVTALFWAVDGLRYDPHN